MTNKRVTNSVTIDERIWELIKENAGRRKISISKYLEEYFINEFKRTCILSPDFEILGETRGGDRTKGD